MNLMGATVNEVPNGLRSLLNVGCFLKDVLDRADNNARARVDMGQAPDLLEDVLKGAHVHIPKLEELVTDLAGRSTAKTMAEFMMQTHSVLGLLNDLMETADDAESPPPAPGGPSFRAASAAEQGTGTPGFRPENTTTQAANSPSGAPSRQPRFRPEFTSAAKPAAQTAAQDPVESRGAGRQPDKPPRKPTINAFKLDVARHLLAFEEAVAAEQADLRRRIISANSEAAALRAELRLLESERAMRAPEPPPQCGPPVADNTVAISTSPPKCGPPVADNTAAISTSPPSSGTAAEAPSSESTTEAPTSEAATADDDGTIPEEEATEIMDMILASQQRVHASLASDRELVETLGGELSDLRQQVTRLQAPS